MTTIPDPEYRRAKQRVVDVDRQELVQEFTRRYGPDEGLERLSMRTGQPLSLYIRIARSLGLFNQAAAEKK